MVATFWPFRLFPPFCLSPHTVLPTLLLIPFNGVLRGRRIAFC